MAHKVTLTTGEVLTLPRGGLSPSALEMYLRCPMQFYWRYIEGRTEAPGVAQITGISGHAALELNNRNKMAKGDDLPAATVIECFKDTFADKSKEIEKWGDDKPDVVIAQTVPGLKCYMEEDAPSITPVATEQPFQIDADGLPIFGFVDMVTNRDSVYDYKFVGRRSPYLQQGAVEKSVQLTTYYAAMNMPNVGYIAIIKPGDSKTKPQPGESKKILSSRKPEDWLYAKELYLSAARAISAGAFPLCGTGNFLCSERFCGYWHRCKGGLLAGRPIQRYVPPEPEAPPAPAKPEAVKEYADE